VRTVSLIVLLLLLPSVAEAAPPDRKPWRLWGGLGFGSGGNDDDNGVAIVTQLVFQKAPHHLALRLGAIADLYDPGSCDLLDAGVLYGRTAMGPMGHATIAAGLALTDAGCPVGVNESPEVLGIPVVAEAAFRPLPVLGIGLQGFVNFNSRNRYGGMVVFLQLGWLPK
jgi:hypothetical protein